MPASQKTTEDFFKYVEEISTWSVLPDSKALPKLQAPIETTRTHCYVQSAVAVNVGYESPLFACLERVYHTPLEGPETKYDPSVEPAYLVLYELDNSINAILKRGEHQLDSTANRLESIPGPLFDCPGGVLDFSLGSVTYFPCKSTSQLFPIPPCSTARSPFVLGQPVLVVMAFCSFFIHSFINSAVV